MVRSRANNLLWVVERTADEVGRSESRRHHVEDCCCDWVVDVVDEVL
jgi:hypothetical protein